MTLSGEPAFEDMTAKARLRETALRLFAEEGIEGTTVRDIARMSGVSLGLIRHHFGSKDGLRAACDTYAIEQMVHLKKEIILDGKLADRESMSSFHPRMLVLIRYVARSVCDGSPSADAMFSQIVSSTQDWIEAQFPGEFADPRMQAALVVATEIGILVMHKQFSDVLGADALSPKGHLQLARAKVEFYSKPLISPEVAATALETIEKLQDIPNSKQHEEGGAAC